MLVRQLFLCVWHGWCYFLINKRENAQLVKCRHKSRTGILWTQHRTCESWILSGAQRADHFSCQEALATSNAATM